MSVLSSIEDIAVKAREELARVGDEKSLEQWRVAFMGRKSALQSVLRSLGDVDADERRDAGRAANELKGELEHSLETKRNELISAKSRDSRP